MTDFSAALVAFNPPGQVQATLGNPFGKDIANAELFRALALHFGASAKQLAAAGGAGALPAQLLASAAPEHHLCIDISWCGSPN